MSKSILEQFRQEVLLKDPVLKERIEATTSPEEMASLVFQVSQEKGYNFTLDQVISAITEVAQEKNWQFSAPEQELSDQQLEAIAGGRAGTEAQAFLDNWGCSL